MIIVIMYHDPDWLLSLDYVYDQAGLEFSFYSSLRIDRLYVICCCQYYQFQVQVLHLCGN